MYINQKKHGAGTSRNLAIKKSKGEFLAFIDSDDVWDKQKLTKQIKFMKKNNISASFTSYSIIDFFGKQIGGNWTVTCCCWGLEKAMRGCPCAALAWSQRWYTPIGGPNKMSNADLRV